VYTGEVVDFNASASYDPDGTIVSYSWDFGDGTTESGATVRHSYVEDGLYTVILRVVDNEGLVGSKVAIQIVKNRPPVAALTEATSIINEKEAVSFYASPSHDLDGTIVSYSWDFGDGTTATGNTVTHSYTNTGFYNVTLTVTDNDGATDTRVHPLHVTNVVNNPPVASFTATAETVNIDETLSFDASETYDSDGSIVAYSWDFGDGTAVTGVTAEHAYSQAGTYTVTLTVTDNDGITDTTTTTISATTQPAPNQSPIASFTKSAETAFSGETLSFDASETYDSDGSIVAYSWDFGDGTAVTGVTAEHAYSQAGTYTVTLTVTDNDGASSSTVAETTVETETTITLAVISGIGIGITALTAMLLYVSYKKIKKKKQPKEN
jgi:PKD repeat protein